MRCWLAVVLVIAAACGKGAGPSFEQLRAETYDALHRGDIERARSAAARGRKRAADRGAASWAWTFQVAQAEVLVSQRRNVEVVAFLDEGLARHRDADEVRVRALMTRGVARCLSRPAGAAAVTDDLDEASRIATALSSKKLMGEIALRRGTCHLLEADLARAEVRFREALAAAQAEGLAFLEANAAGSLGLLRIWTGRYDEATEWLRRSLKLATTIRADAPRAKTLQNLGWCYFKLGDLDRAVPLLQEAEALAGRRHLVGDQLLALTNLGNALYRRGDHARASEHYRRGLDVARGLGDRGVTAQLLGNLGVIAFEQGRYDEAEALHREALEVQKALGDEFGRLITLLNQGHLWAARPGTADLAEAAYRQVLASSVAAPEAQWEARSGLALLHVRAGRSADAETEFREAFTAMERSRDLLAAAENRISFFSSLRRFHDEHVAFLVDAGRVEDALLVADRGRARLLTESLRPSDRPAIGDVARYRRVAGAMDAVLLFYWTARGRSFLWAVTRDEVALRVLPGEADIGKRIEAHQARILRSRDLLEDAADATWLYRTLIGPVEDRIRPGKHVIVVPDGPLHQLNFDTLVVPGARPHYWIEDVALATAPSLGLLGASDAVERPGLRSILVIGDPVSPGDEFPPLVHAGSEVARIAALFGPAATVRSRAEAAPSAYAAASPDRFALIHFAAHAAANRESPLDSAVVLSGREDSYKLYARDIVEVPLTAALVTLSACRSAGSRAYAGEGLVGLAWAFLGSGARNVIGGLWNVEDESTARLMEHLYRGLKDGLDPVAALRASKLRLLRSDTAARKPYYWAPFVIYTRGGQGSP